MEVVSMDPVATLEAIDTAMRNKDRAAIAEHADALIGWLERGGFMPVGPHGTDWRGKLDRSELKSVLRWVRAVAEMP
jgi:hypothetical protein